MGIGMFANARLQMQDYKCKIANARVLMQSKTFTNACMMSNLQMLENLHKLFNNNMCEHCCEPCCEIVVTGA